MSVVGSRGLTLMQYSPTGSAERHRAERGVQLLHVPEPYLPATHLHTTTCEGKYCDTDIFDEDSDEDKLRHIGLCPFSTAVLLF